MNRHAFLTALAAAALALSVAACAGGMVDTPSAAGGSRPAAGGADRSVQEVTVVAHDSMRFEPTAVTLEAGRPVRLTLRNEGKIPHDFTLTQGVPRPITLVAAAGESASASFTLARPGTYQFVCAQPGHAQAGMRGTITATRAGSAGAASTAG